MQVLTIISVHWNGHQVVEHIPGAGEWQLEEGKERNEDIPRNAPTAKFGAEWLTTLSL